nr:uncharacterized protein LOC106686532 [Halyomorpha halys]
MLPWRLGTFFILIFFTNLNGCLSYKKSKTFSDLDILLPEILKNGIKRKNYLSGNEKHINDKEIQFNMTNRNRADENLFREGLIKILKSILDAPKGEEDLKPWDFSEKESNVRPMIRFPERSSKTSKTDLDNVIEDILLRIEKSMHKQTTLGEKKNNRGRTRNKNKSTTTESYERRRLKDFLTILDQLRDMGISFKQMDQISKEPVKYKKIGESLDERQKVSMLEKLIDECNGVGNEVKIADYHDTDHELEEVVKILGKKSGTDLKGDLVKLLYSLNSFVY